MTTNELRVFISSTFRDLQDEREHLVKKIFPEIHTLCRARGITFTEVDLRWGLTEEDVALGRIIRTCFEEIDRCRPYFIGITGDRYGYVPETTEIYKDPDLLARYPWLEDAVMDEASIIDMEFRHGALNGGGETAAFFFRGPHDERSVDETEARRLDALKQRVRAAGLRVKEFQDPESLGAMIREELVSVIERDFAAVRPPTPLERERAGHAAFAASRRHAYIPNPAYTKRLTEFAASDSAPLVIYAESGSGKSSLVSFWCAQYRARNPDAVVIEHYVGIGAGSGDHYAIMRHVMNEIKERFERTEDVPATPEKIEREFANWLGFATDRTIVLVIDGINQLTGAALNLGWLPKFIPKNVRLIVTSTVEGTLVELRRRGWIQLGMQPLSTKEREAVIVRFLAEYHKSLAPAQLHRITGDEKCAHPLFLRTMLEELRLFGEHERLDEVIDAYLSTTGTEDLFQVVLDRFEASFSATAIRDVLSLLWMSRAGLSETELAEISGVSRLNIASLVLALDYHLVRKDGLLTFFHDYLRRAVEKRYLGPGDRSAAAMRLALAEYFERQPVTERSARELLWQYREPADAEKLRTLLGTIPAFMVLHHGETKYEVLRAWKTLIDGGADIEATYRDGIAAFRATCPTAAAARAAFMRVGLLFDELARWGAGATVVQEAVAEAARGDDRWGEADGERLLGWLLQMSGDHDKAMACLEHARMMFEELGDQHGIADATGNIGHIHWLRGDYDRALACHEQVRSIYEQLGERLGLATAAGNIGILHEDRGEHDQAIDCYELQRTICEELGDRRGLSLVAGNMGVVYLALGEYDRAMECMERQYAFCEELGDRVGLARAVGNMGLVHAQRGEYDRAIAHHERHRAIAEELGDYRAAGIAVGNTGSAHLERGEHEHALRHFTQAATGHRNLGFRYGLTFWLEGTARALLEIAIAHPAMPEYLSQFLPENADTPERTWHSATLRHARACVEECLSIARDLQMPDTIFSGNILLARIDAQEGDTAKARQRLVAMLGEAKDDADRAELRYWLWNIAGDDADKAAALRLYEALFAATPKHEYAARVEELSV